IKPARMPFQRELNSLSGERVRCVLENQRVYGIPVSPIDGGFDVPVCIGTERNSAGSHLWKGDIQSAVTCGRVGPQLRSAGVPDRGRAAIARAERPFAMRLKENPRSVSDIPIAALVPKLIVCYSAHRGWD